MCVLFSFCLHYISLSHINVFRVFQSVCLRSIASTMNGWHERGTRLRMLRRCSAPFSLHRIYRRWLGLLNALVHWWRTYTRIQVRNVGVRRRRRGVVMLLMVLTAGVDTWPPRLLLLRVQWWTAHRLCCCRLIDVLLLNEVEVLGDNLWIIKLVVEFPMFVLLHVHLLDLFEWVPLIKLLYRILEVVEAQYHDGYVVEGPTSSRLFQNHFYSFCNCLMNSYSSTILFASGAPSGRVEATTS